ncbi:GNAT family N-acetyltransferase [uncultured Lutibacter sp.]|uniref:GNAT family N-acetyltransferase n=1 Tax=uncultured Lutibacter sp. TaxID=437739 RepID=UPI002619F64F|nr:GNAT family N-acetyltransferase [uncultured Lutibacter sp.]
MKIILETERLFLREFVPSDGFHFFYLNNDPEVIKYTGNQPFKNLEEANNFILNYSEYNKYGFGRWAVCLKETSEFVGWCGFKFDKDSSEIDLGFRFYKKYWGIGYATEAAKGCLQFGFLDLNFKEVVGRCYIENKASINVLEKCNFKFQKNILYDSKQAKLYTFKNDNNKKN